MSKYLIKLGQNSKKAHKIIDTKIKNNVLKSFVKLIFKNKNKILLENLKDIRFAKKKGLKKNLVNRLELNNEKLNSIIEAIKTVIKLKDPVNYELSKWTRPNGLKIKKVINENTPPVVGNLFEVLITKVIVKTFLLDLYF